MKYIITYNVQRGACVDQITQKVWDSIEAFMEYTMKDSQVEYQIINTEPISDEFAAKLEAMIEDKARRWQEYQKLLWK